MTPCTSREAIRALGRLDRAALPAGDYCRRVGIDWISTEPATGGLNIARIVIGPGSRFDFADPGDPHGIDAAVVAALAADGETEVDLVAWPTARPALMLTALGEAAVLGAWNAVNPASFAFGPMPIYRTALGWLQGGGIGAVLVDLDKGARWLRDVDGPIAAEDPAHAAELRDAMIGTVRLDRLYVPRTLREAA